MAKPRHFATPDMIRAYEAGAPIRGLMARWDLTYCEVRRGLINAGVQLRTRLGARGGATTRAA